MTEKIAALIFPLLEERQLELVDLEYQREGRDWFVRIFIDKPGGVTLDDCADVSREVDDLIEVEELIEHAYRLEISSPGLDRPLKKAADYVRFVGESVKIKTFEQIDPDNRGQLRKTFTGILLEPDHETIRIEQRDRKGGIAELQLSQIAKANLDPQF
jgi:ribosome maturation factor RimP